MSTMTVSRQEIIELAEAARRGSFAVGNAARAGDTMAVKLLAEEVQEQMASIARMADEAISSGGRWVT